MLSKRDRECLDYVTGRINADGISPSLDEIADALCVKSKASAHRAIAHLIARGYVKRLAHGKHRALEVLRTASPPIPRPAPEPVVIGPNAAYFTVQRIEGEAKLVPMEAKR